MKPVSGILLVDKPGGITSALVVRRLSRLLDNVKCGHLGTLDPMATGLLVVCVGNAVKLVSYYRPGTKQYIADVAFGSDTTTDDAEGQVLDTAPVPGNLESAVRLAIPSFLGTIQQKPPRFSAVKVKGRRMYKMARRGVEFEVPLRTVTIHDIRILAVHGDCITLDVSCSSGTYIRSLARDLGEACLTKAHLTALRRLQSEPFSLDGALPFDQLMANPDLARQAIHPVEKWMPPLPVVELSAAEETDVRCGRPVERALELDGAVVLMSPSGHLLAIGTYQAAESRIKVKRVIDTQEQPR